MRLLPLASLEVPSRRQRTDIAPDALTELMRSIQVNGLLHPPVVRQEGEKFFLVAGERRFKAIRLLALTGSTFSYEGEAVPPGYLPVQNLGELDPLQAHEAELEENIRRVDLSMQDRVKAVSQLHELRSAQAASEGRTHTIADTGVEAFPQYTPEWAKEATRQAIVIAKNLEKLPELAKAKTESEAMKIIKRAGAAEQSKRLAEVIGQKATNELLEIYHADATEWLGSYEGPGFDCLLIDPPYGMEAESFGDAAGRLVGIGHSYTDTPESFRALMGAVAPLLWKVSAPESHLYCYCDIDGFHFLRELFQQQGWWVFRTPLVHLKREGGRVPWPEHGPRRCYELVLYAVRGKRPVTAIYRDVFDTTLEGDNLGHGAQKPVEAYVELLKRSCRPGDRVLDCFAGSGTVIAAAHQLKLRAVAVEKDQTSYGMCLQRLEGLK